MAATNPTLSPTPTKQEYFEYFIKRMTWDTREERIAVRYNDDTPVLSAYLYLVDADDGKGYTVQTVHDFIPLSQYENEKPLLEKMHGPFTPLGRTYEFEPFFLGIERFGKEDTREDEVMRLLFSRRENYQIMQYNEMVEEFFNPANPDSTGYRALYERKPEARPLILKFLEEGVAIEVLEMTDEEYQAEIDGLVAHKAGDEHLITYEQAWQKALPFLASNPKEDLLLIKEGAKKEHAERSIFKKFNIDGLTL